MTESYIHHIYTIHNEKFSNLQVPGKQHIMIFRILYAMLQCSVCYFSLIKWKWYKRCKDLLALKMASDEEHVHVSDESEPKPKSKTKKPKEPGIIFLSRIPMMMNVTTIRSIFCQYGEIGKIFLQPDSKYYACSVFDHNHTATCFLIDVDWHSRNLKVAFFSK